MTNKEFKLSCMVNNLIAAISMQSDMTEEEMWKWLKSDTGITKGDWKRIRSDLNRYTKEHPTPNAYNRSFRPLDN